MAYTDLVTCIEETAPGTHLFVLGAVLFLDANQWELDFDCKCLPCPDKELTNRTQKYWTGGLV